MRLRVLFLAAVLAVSEIGERGVTAAEITFQQRVAYQRAIEEVFWRHRLWPEGNTRPKPPLACVLSEEELRAKVSAQMRKSEIIEGIRGRKIAEIELQGEIARMAAETAQPGVLGELWAALGRDPFVIAECLARPALVESQLMHGREDFQQRLDRVVSSNLGSYFFRRAAREQTSPGGYFLPAITAVTRTVPLTGSAPQSRHVHSTVWTGTEMIVWGGETVAGSSVDILNSGGRYVPATNSWSATSTDGAPLARAGHTAVWSGQEMLIWGGENLGLGSYFRDGARYDPMSDKWGPIPLTGAPAGRGWHSAVWATDEMIVFGGYHRRDSTIVYHRDAKRFDPAAGLWRPVALAAAPTKRYGCSAVWDGARMIVWGGVASDAQGTLLRRSGGLYNASSNTWSGVSITNAPAATHDHTAVWAQTEMILWGHETAPAGWRYDPTSNAWATIASENSADGLIGHESVWTGSEMFVWGGGRFVVSGDDLVWRNATVGGRYDPATDKWTRMKKGGQPLARTGFSMVWTGSQLVIWGGLVWPDGASNYTVNDGKRYDTVNNRWLAMR